MNTLNLTGLIAEAFGQAAEPCQAVIGLADAMVQAGALEAGHIVAIVADVRAAAEPAKRIKAVCKDFADRLEAAGYKGAPQRKCDLKAILVRAIADAGFDAGAAGGLQAAAKAARAKPEAAQTVDAGGDGSIGISVRAQLKAGMLVMIENATVAGFEELAGDLVILLNRHFD